MAEINQYVDILADGLRKKLVLLDNIIESNKQLEQAAAQAEMDMDQFKALIDGKDECVNQINQLDAGFQSLFDRVKEELQNHKDDYKQQIQTMQQYIREITDKIVQIQDLEARNRLAIEGQFSRMRRNISEAKQGMNVAQSYYKSMSKTNVVGSHFMDKKN